MCLASLVGCASSHEADAPGDTDAPVDEAAVCVTVGNGELLLPSPANNGVFDPSLDAGADGRAWMSYSVVERTVEGYDRVSTRLAYSDDAGSTWCENGAVNANTPAPAFTDGVWNHEVSSLVRDPDGTADARWLMFTHTYTLAGSDRRFETGFIAVRHAATPGGLAAAGEDHLVVEGEGLADCAVYTEPGALWRSDGLYLALTCATGNADTTRILLFVLDRSSGHYAARGTLLRASDVTPFSPLITGVQAAALFATGGATHLIASPTVGDLYAGCLDYAVDLATATVGNPLHVLAGAPGELTGACDTDAALTTGVLMSQTTFATRPTFHVESTGVAW